MPRIRANRRARVNSGAGLTDEQIKARNEAAHKAFLAARRAAQAGSDQSNTKIRTRTGKDGKAVTNMQDKKTGDKNTKEVRAARAEAKRSGVRDSSEKIQPFRAGRISHTGGGMGNVDPYGTQARGAGNTFSAQGSSKDMFKPEGSKKKKSLDVLQGMLKGMMVLIKDTDHDELTAARASKRETQDYNFDDDFTIGNDSPTPKPKGKKKKITKAEWNIISLAEDILKENGIKQEFIDKYEGEFRSLKDPKKRDQDKAQKKRSLRRQSNEGSDKRTTAGMNYISSIKSKATCRLWKAELNDTFNTLLDNFQHLYKNTPRDGSKDDNFDRDFQSYSTEARSTGTNPNTKMRQRKQEGKPEVKEVKTGDRFNLQRRLGTANTLQKALELIEELSKSIFDEQVANRGGKKYPITNTGRSGKGALGGDDTVKPKAIGESQEDQDYANRHQ